MTLARQFIRARIVEVRSGVWELSITNQYYGLYQWVDHSVHESLEKAKDALIKHRCDDYLCVSCDGAVITLGT